jgi:hypothetical protein
MSASQSTQLRRTAQGRAPSPPAPTSGEGRVRLFGRPSEQLNRGVIETRSRAHHCCGAQAVQRPSKVQKLIPDGQVEVASGDWVGIALISCTSITPLPPVGVVTVS